MSFIAHTKNGLGQQQDLLLHLRMVGEDAARFARVFGAADLAWFAGILHDIGKFNPVFQRYLLDAEAGIAKAGSGPEHKGAGGVFAAQHQMDCLAFLIAGHHGGLPAKKKLRTEWLPGYQRDPAVQQAIQTAEQTLPELHRSAYPTPPAWLAGASVEELEFFIRMLFSTLVDADYLDTERHFTAGNAPDREGYPNLDELWTWFQVNQQQLSGQHPNPLNILRHEVYEACVTASTAEPGFFRLTVPTGGGKTRSSLAFALGHARAHGMQRVIYAIPYMSITEQTSDSFREIFAAHNTRAVLEHHSGVIASDPESPTLTEIWAKLSAENWDAPLIVTTTVQLFESLLAQKTTPCRKLHAIAGSVIILDEAQTLPPALLISVLDVLRQLVAHYGVTVVLCTATQPALDDQHDFKGLPNVREIVSDPTHLFTKLKRVQYHWPQPEDTWSWEHAAERMHTGRQALTIVNTRRDAAALFAALQDPQALHLSTWMCGAHRRTVLDEVRRRLKAHEPCLLVSTQLIEAGVDVDFPQVLRAMGPLDSIVQAAGRCNREGKMTTLGDVIIFRPVDGKLPKGPYSTGTDVTQTLAAHGPLDFDDLATYQSYFQRYYRHVDRDAKRVQEARRLLDYPIVAERFRMIDDDTLPVIVSYAPDAQKIVDLVARLRRAPAHARGIIRQLQPYMVDLRRHDIALAKSQGLAHEIAEMPGIFEWHGQYDPAQGILLDAGIDPGLLFW